MPNVDDIVEIIENAAESERMSPIRDRPLCLDRGDKPPDWEQLTSEQRAALYEKFKSRLEIVAHDRRMLEAKPRDPKDQFRKLQQQKAQLLAEEPQGKRETVLTENLICSGILVLAALPLDNLWEMVYRHQDRQGESWQNPIICYKARSTC